MCGQRKEVEVYWTLFILRIREEMKQGIPPLRVRQYPISAEGKKGLTLVIRELIRDGILEPCMSPHNTPMLPVRKPNGTYRLVQDLREINKHMVSRYPIVSNSYSLLGRIPPSHAWFSVIDLKDAFWACPLAEESRNWFAFEWEDQDSGRKQQRWWTRLPQGFTESPNLFRQALENLLHQFEPSENTQILQYVDNLLVLGEREEQVQRTTIDLLNFLGRKGLKISKSKLQFVELEVRYLAHIIGSGFRKLSSGRVQGILSLPPPKMKKDIRKLLGLIGYCKLWIDGYAKLVKFLYDKLVDVEPLNWNIEDKIY